MKTLDFDSSPYHYKESGLDNLWLCSGFQNFFDKDSDQINLRIESVPYLHMQIGKTLIRTIKPLTGSELRFLRADLSMAYEEPLNMERMANLIGVGEHTYAEYERNKNKAIPGSVDRLIRLICGEYYGLRINPIRPYLTYLSKSYWIKNTKMYAEWNSQDNWIIRCEYLVDNGE